jgi:putative hydrolase of the HAD superfamily
MILYFLRGRQGSEAPPVASVTVHLKIGSQKFGYLESLGSFQYISRVMGKAIEAVIFDFGNVLTYPPLPESIHRLEELSRMERGALEREVWRHRPEYDRGTIDGMQYWFQVIKAGGGTPSLQQARELIREDVRCWTRINESVLAWALDLGGLGYKTALLSNMPRDHLKALVKRFTWIERFDVAIFSCRLGLIKPEAAIYQACLQELKTDADRVVFLDDTLVNVHGARSVGMQAIHFRSFEDTLKTLRELELLPEVPMTEGKVQ